MTCGERSGLIDPKGLKPAQYKLYVAIEVNLRKQFENVDALKIASDEAYTTALNDLDALQTAYDNAGEALAKHRSFVNSIENRLGIRHTKCYGGKNNGKRVFLAPYTKKFVPDSVIKTLMKIERLRLIGRPSEAKQLKIDLINKYTLDVV